MAEEQAPPPKRTLGHYVMYPGPRHFPSIAIPATAKALEIKPVFLTLISTYQFTTMDREDPYTHLDTFYELVGTMGFQSADICVCFLFHWQERLRDDSNHFQIRTSLAGRM